MVRVAWASLVGALVIFAWGMISWMVLPWHNMNIHPLPKEDAVIDTFRASAPMKSGVYFFPFVDMEGNADAKTQEAFIQKHKRGPIGMVVFQAEGADPMSSGVFLGGFVLNVVSAFLTALLLAQTLPGRPPYLQRVVFVGLLGVFAAVVSYASLWNWFSHPLDYSIVMGADLVVGWTLTGLVQGAVLRPPPMPAS